MSAGGRKAHILEALDSHIRNIEETFQILEKSAASTLEKVEWSQVIKLGDEVSKQATIAGMLWSEKEAEIKQLEENMDAYFNVLHGFVLLCYGSTAGAGPTLHASILASARKVVDSSLVLLKEAVSIDSHNFNMRSSIPQLSGSVWETCANLKKIPISNYSAIGRAITHIAVSVKDVLREMNELKPSAASIDASHNDEDSSDDDFGDDLSREEMFIAQLAIKAVSDALAALKEAIRFISSLHLKPNCESMEHINLLEKLLGCCKEIGSQVNELGASLYPPQEVSVLKSTAEKIYIVTDEMMKVVEMVGGSHENVLASLKGLESSLKKMEAGLSNDVSGEMERLAL